MAVLDIVAIGILAVTVIVCTLKGFAKILLQTFSWFFAWLCTKLFGAKLIGYFFSEVLALDPKWDWLTPLCVVLLFWLLWFLFRFVGRGIAAFLRRVLPLAGVLDRVLGALFGILLSVAFIALAGYCLRFLGEIVPDSGEVSRLADMAEDSVIFRIFM